MRVLGVDPGQTGGLAIVDSDAGFIKGIRMPMLTIKGKKILNACAVDEWLVTMDHKLPEPCFDVAVIEQVSAMPRQGVTSSFQFGRSTGAIEAMVTLWGKPTHWITPSVWKKALGLSPNKRDSMGAASLRFGQNKLWDVLANDGIAEAALLASYWMQK